ncbi:MAG: hypothetical protein Q9220_003923 [cf. Caloplaca sp. 1 TL-2023]
MSRTYIGPFGRILPVIDNSDDDSSSTEGQGRPSQEPRASMATYQLRPPAVAPLPTRLDFGSDPRPGFSEPRNYDIFNPPRRNVEQQRQSFEEPRRSYNGPPGQLPSVSQLLTSGSQSSSASSPYTAQQSPASPKDGHEQPSPLHPSLPAASPPAGHVPYQSTFTSGPYRVSSRDNSLPPRRPSFAGGAVVAPYAMPSPVPYGASLNSATQANAAQARSHSSFSQQSLHTPTMAAPPLQPPQPPSSYGYASASSDQSPANVAQVVKPLPRVVGEQDIPGEGPCWVYEDGSICRKIIDGELVNAQWGVTKAGKPRKRLAIACTTCREKKIKCDPGEEKCQQCDKFGRECRFTTA